MKYLALILISFFAMNSWGSDLTYSSKLLLRTGIGQLTNTGTQSGSAASVGSLNLQFLKYLSPRWSLIFGYMAEFDTSNGSMPVSGMEIGSRYYFWNEGTKVQEKFDWGTNTSRSLWALYISGIYGKRQFYLGQDYQSTDPTTSLKGEYAIINAGVGMDYYLSKNYEFNAELSTSVLSLASSDSRVNLSETFLWIGLSYVY